MDKRSMVNPKFISFLKGTLGKMVSTHTFSEEFINLELWETWPRKFYNIMYYDSTKEQVSADVMEREEQLSPSLLDVSICLIVYIIKIKLATNY